MCSPQHTARTTTPSQAQRTVNCPRVHALSERVGYLCPNNADAEVIKGYCLATQLDSVTPVTEGGFPVLPKKIAAWRGKFSAPREKIPCPTTTENLPQVTGMTASIVSRIAKSAPIPKELPAEFPAAGNSRILADRLPDGSQVGIRRGNADVGTFRLFIARSPDGAQRNPG